jgi:hypothetical protein
VIFGLSYAVNERFYEVAGLTIVTDHWNVAVDGSEGREGQVLGAELLQGPDYA